MLPFSRFMEESMKKIVALEWEDHCSGSGWKYEEDIDGLPIIINSIGYVVNETPKTITISTAIASTGASPEPMTILKSCIKKRQSVKLK